MGDASPSARLGQRARSLPPERSPGFGADDGFEAGTPDQARKRASIRGAADVAGARRELLLPDGLAALTERGGKASTAEIKEQELDRECDKLATVECTHLSRRRALARSQIIGYALKENVKLLRRFSASER